MATSLPVTIPVPEGYSLAADFVEGEGEFAVVWVHGFGSHRGGEKSAALARACASRGWPFLTADFRGHGGSTGTMRELTADRLLADLDAVHGFLADRGHTRLGLVGSSMGGFAAAWFARAHREAVVGCVLLAPAFGFLERRWNALDETQREGWRRTGVLRVVNEWVDVEIGLELILGRERFAPALLAQDWQTPALIFHGLADEVVPVGDSLDFLQAARFPDLELRLLKAGDHRLLAFKEELAAEAVRFFDRRLGR